MYVRVDSSNRPIAYPYQLSYLRTDFVNVSFPRAPSLEVLAEFSIFPVISVDQPTYNNRTQKCVLGDPEFVGGVWTQTWVTTNLTEEESNELTIRQARIVRDVRDEHLRESDWTQVADAAVDKSAWAAYRQLLRDLPESPGFPWDISWPTRP